MEDSIEVEVIDSPPTPEQWVAHQRLRDWIRTEIILKNASEAVQSAPQETD